MHINLEFLVHFLFPDWVNRKKILTLSEHIIWQVKNSLKRISRLLHSVQLFFTGRMNPKESNENASHHSWWTCPINQHRAFLRQLYKMNVLNVALHVPNSVRLSVKFTH